MTGFKATANNPQVDRLPLEAIVGWDATLNGNLAQLLQEPTLMGALEGAAITVLSKGVNFPSNPFAADTFPAGHALAHEQHQHDKRLRRQHRNGPQPVPEQLLVQPVEH